LDVEGLSRSCIAFSELKKEFPYIRVNSKETVSRKRSPLTQNGIWRERVPIRAKLVENSPPKRT